MKNNEMINYNQSLIEQNKKKYNNVQEKSTNKVIEGKTEKRSNLISNIKVDSKIVNSVIDKKNFLEKINGNVELLNMLSIDRLKKLEEYYDSVIEENNKTIKKLRKKL